LFKFDIQLQALPHPSSGDGTIPNAPGDGRLEHLWFLSPGINYALTEGLASRDIRENWGSFHSNKT
jgi:hypothetical protein